MVKVCSSTVEVPLILNYLSIVRVGGIPHVAVKCIDMRRNTKSEGSLLGNN